MIVAQITDFHIGPPGSVFDTRYDTPGHLRRAVAHLNGLRPRPACVLGTGDLVEKGSAEEYARLRDILAGLELPIYLIPGNHDDRAGLARAFADAGYMPEPGGFIQYAVEDGPLRLLALDTSIPGESGGTLCPIRLAWLEAQLAAAPDRPTLIFMHHPPFRTGIARMDMMGLADADAFAEVLRRFGNVERIVCGHLHRPITRRFAGTVASTCPATAHQIGLDLETERLSMVMEPPAAMLHLWLGPEDGLVSHVSYLGEGFRTDVIFDGGEWRQPPAA